MSIINSQPLIGASGNQVTGYNLTKSLRFRNSASAYLNRTPASASNRRTWTWSGWIKRGILGTGPGIFEATSAGKGTFFTWGSDNLVVQLYDNTYNTVWNTSSVFRDPSAWYHVILAVDTTQASQANMVKIYVNGVQQSLTVNNYSTSLPQNYDTFVNNTVSHNINTYIAASYGDQYYTEVNFVDGQALTPSSFGETDSITGVWKPKAYTGTYGTNGFYLKFTDVATTSGSNAGLGKDFSGNGNYWTTNNISVTAGTTYDSMTDVPTLTSATAANYAVINPLFIKSTFVLSNANLEVTNSTESQGKSFSTISMKTGKWYWEARQTTANAFAQLFGISNLANVTASSGEEATGTSWSWGTDNLKFYNGSSSSWGNASNNTSETYMFALDMDNGKIWFGVDGTWFSSGSPSAGTNAAFTGITGEMFATVRPYGGNKAAMNFGQRPFAYTPPTGFKALNTYNLPDSTIVAGNKYMDATLFTSTGTTQTVTNAGGFKPDLIWTKVRNTTFNHYLVDTNRGLANNLNSDLTIAEVSYPQFVTTANSNGFTLGTSNYANGNSVVGWQWQAGQGTTSSNTSGTITSTVSVNASAGFSIVTYTGTGSNATVGHGLGVAPAFIIIKSRNTVTDWGVYHQSLGATQNLILDQTAGAGTTAAYWNNTAPTSSVFTVNTAQDVNKSAGTYVAYCWAEIAGFSKAFSYTGNGSADGAFVYCGFRPKFVMIKRTDASEQWYINDTSRDTYNLTGKSLRAQDSGAEASIGGASSATWDILSNGFKLRDTGGGTNASSGSYIGIAFAENPFKNSLAR